MLTLAADGAEARIERIRREVVLLSRERVATRQEALDMTAVERFQWIESLNALVAPDSSETVSDASFGGPR